MGHGTVERGEGVVYVCTEADIHTYNIMHENLLSFDERFVPPTTPLPCSKILPMRNEVWRQLRWVF